MITCRHLNFRFWCLDPTQLLFPNSASLQHCSFLCVLEVLRVTSGRARLITLGSDGPNMLRVCAEEIRVFRAARRPRVPVPVPGVSGLTELVSPGSVFGCVLRANLKAEDGGEEFARRDQSRFHSRRIRKITCLDRVGTLVTPLLQLRGPDRTGDQSWALAAVRRSSADRRR